MDTRDPLKIICSRCGAKPGGLCVSEDGEICLLHEERRLAKRKKPGATMSPIRNTRKAG